MLIANYSLLIRQLKTCMANKYSTKSANQFEIIKAITVATKKLVFQKNSEQAPKIEEKYEGRQ